MLCVIFVSFALNCLVQGGKCTGPSNSTCSGSQTTCATTPGCNWSQGDNGTCSGPGDQCHEAATQSACTAISNCAWESEGSWCLYPDEEDCIVLSQSSCTASTGCLWRAATGQCSGPSYSECQAKTQTECNVPNRGCEYYTSSGSCEFDQNACRDLSPTVCAGKNNCQWYPGNCYVSGSICYGLSQTACAANTNCLYRPYEGRCRTPENNDSNICENLNPTDCTKTSGCTFYGGNSYCRSPNSSAYCYSNDANDGCDVNSDASCSWVLVSAGYCYFSGNSSSVDCWSLSETMCAASGCIWDPQYNGGYCDITSAAESLCMTKSDGTACADGSPSICSFGGGWCDTNYYDCQNNDAGTACNTESTSSNGCYWKAGSGSCRQASNIQCYKNTAGTACDASSSSACTFKSQPGYCYSNRDLICLNNDSGTGCVTTANGCKWRSDFGECYDSLICFRNAGNTSCDAGSDSGCTWKGATAPGCVSSNDGCYSNAGGNGCADYSTSLGCVWNSDSSLIMYVPSSLLLVLLLLSL